VTQSGQYPKRGRYFSNRFLRILTKTCAAQDIGPDGCWLLTVIASLEDAKHYSDAVTFYNGQLMAVTAFTREHSLIAARTRAVEAGWLHYEPGRKRKPGRYWVTIPTRFAPVPDGPCDEDPCDYADDNASETDVISLTLRAGEAEGKRQRKRRESVSPSYPIPIPIPSPPTPSAIAERIPASSEGGGGGLWEWQEAERELRKLGIAKAREAVDGAKSIGMTPQTIASLISEWQAAQPAYDLGALYWRLTHGVWPERSGNTDEEKWVAAEKRRTKAILAQVGERPDLRSEKPLAEQLREWQARERA